MYVVRPFPGRVNAAGEKEFGGIYCWFANANEKFTRDYGGGKTLFKDYGLTEGGDEEEKKRKRYGSFDSRFREEPVGQPHSFKDHALPSPTGTHPPVVFNGEFSRHPPLLN